MPAPPPSTSPFWKVFGLVTKLDRALLRATKGRRSFVSRSPTLVLHHVGRKSGEARATPLIYLDRDPDLVIVASKGGTDKNPAWFHNLTAMATTEVELPGGERRTVRPHVASPEEKAELWPQLVALYSDYATYQSYTDRDIPVVVLQPSGA